MPRICVVGFALLLLLFLGNNSGNYAAQSKQKTSDAPTGTFQKMIVENGSVRMDIDLNRLNGINSLAATPFTLQFAAAANSFFPILVFNDLLRDHEPGSIGLMLQDSPAPAVNAGDYSVSAVNASMNSRGVSALAMSIGSSHLSPVAPASRHKPDNR